MKNSKKFPTFSMVVPHSVILNLDVKSKFHLESTSHFNLGLWDSSSQPSPLLLGTCSSCPMGTVGVSHGAKTTFQGWSISASNTPTAGYLITSTTCWIAFYGVTMCWPLEEWSVLRPEETGHIIFALSNCSTTPNKVFSICWHFLIS
jgi:hypothetical protein